jgi:cytochrome P450
MSEEKTSQDNTHRLFRSAGDDRKTSVIAGAKHRIGFERTADGGVRIYDFALAQLLLRAGGTRQAGFGAQQLEQFSSGAHAPVLFQEGEAHQKQRSATARFFAPKVVTTRYRDLMEKLSEALVKRFQSKGRAQLDDLSLELAVAVAADIIGLTRSFQNGMAERLKAFFATRSLPDSGKLSALAGLIRAQYLLLKFYLFDVRPAIRARRRGPQEDLISHLIDQDYSDREILTECLTYGAAGMATTREFIVIAAWHLLEREELRLRFLNADEAGRISLLEEVLRLEPVVGTLYRRIENDMTLSDGTKGLSLPAGTVVSIDIRGTNSDPAAAGTCPYQLDPDRAQLTAKTTASLMSFGDGPHPCPGGSVALQEAAIFLNRLLRVPGVRLERAPDVSFNPLIASFELRGAIIAADAPA